MKESLDKANAEISERKVTGESLSTTCDELKTKLCESEKLRRVLHNTVQDLKVCVGFCNRSSKFCNFFLKRGF